MKFLVFIAAVCFRLSPDFPFTWLLHYMGCLLFKGLATHLSTWGEKAYTKSLMPTMESEDL